MCLEDTARIPLRGRRGTIRGYALVDTADAAFAKQWRWHLTGGYAVRTDRSDGQKHTVKLHRAILGLAPWTDEVDHIDRDRLNCRRANLRVIPKAANRQNKTSYRGSTSRFRGVSWKQANGKWMVQIQVSGKVLYLGLFTDEDEAGRVAREARLRLLPFAVD